MFGNCHKVAYLFPSSGLNACLWFAIEALYSKSFCKWCGVCEAFLVLSVTTLKNPCVKVLKQERKRCYSQLSVLGLMRGGGGGGQIPYFPGVIGHQEFSLTSKLGPGQWRWIHSMAFGKEHEQTLTPNKAIKASVAGAQGPPQNPNQIFFHP